MAESSHHGRKAARGIRVLLSCLVLALVSISSLAQNIPTRTQKGDIPVWDEQYLRGTPKGWTVPADYHEIFGRDIVPNEIRFGRFGLLSGRFLYTSWRPIKPLTNEQYAQGKVKLLDNHTSEVLTPAFEIELDYVTFLISGGDMPGQACINLLVDGKVVRSATGRDDDVLEWVAFDVKALKGKQAKIQVLDTSTHALGYITVDCVNQSVDPKGATRVIAQPPADTSQGSASAQTIAGVLVGPPVFTDGKMQVAGQAIDLAKLIRLETGVASMPSDAASRIELINGDLLAGEITSLDEEKLTLDQPLHGNLDLQLSQVAQAIFMPGPTVDADPGTLVQINGNLIPGKLVWIREDNIAIDCSLGIVPLPRTRVRSFVFATSNKDADAIDTILFADGSTLSGKLAIQEQKLVLMHDVLGTVELDLSNVARISRDLEQVVRLTDLKGEIIEQVGPIPPPTPEIVADESGDTLRIFPRTVVRYTLPPSDRARRLRAVLMPVANSRTTVTTRINTKDNNWTYEVAPGATGVDIDIELGQASGIEIEVFIDTAQAVAFPSGIEWRSALIVEADAQ